VIVSVEISVIIPAYNAEKTIGRCLDSVLCQAPEMEIIIVDDCSTDQTYDVCKEYQSRYSNIVLIQNDHNIGQGLSRNKGIEAASGKYLSFVDSDDTISQYMYSDMLSLAYRGEYDIVRCGFKRIYEFMAPGIEVTKRLNNIEKRLPWSACTYLYKSVIIKSKKIKFASERYSEDLFFNLEVLDAVETCISTDAEYYFYIDNPCSTMHQYNNPLVKCEKLLSFAEGKNKDIIKRTYLTILNSLPEAATQLIYDTSIPWSEKKRILKQLRNELPFVMCFAV
jgi:glycosyltransferase involved in cell wall biosynthesis